MSATFRQFLRSATRMTRSSSGPLAEVARTLQKAAAALPKVAMPAAPTLRSAGRASAAALAAGTAAAYAFRMPPAMPVPLRSAPARPRTSGVSGSTDDAGGSFVAGSFEHAGRQCHYKLYTPPGAAQATRALPLVVMLHGCTQDPDDFAAGTAMNALAREESFYVLYPAQAQNANPQRCWNWFKHNHQRRGSGEPALIAALTQSVVNTRRIDADRVFVAGLSAGGAMATIVAQAYPDVFAAAGVHSGLARGTARDAMSALNAMRTGDGPVTAALPLDSAASVPTIVFHGDADATVHPRHGAHVLRDALGARGDAASDPSAERERGASTSGQRYSRQVHAGPDGVVRAEYWELHGAGHAWSGGSASGSYTDPRGPDASREMLRFFLVHGRRQPLV